MGFTQDRNDLQLERKHFQLSLITPPLSTNGSQFNKTINDISINTVLGISAGNRTFEAAGFTNINLYYTKGLQIAGFTNISGIRPSDYKSNGIMASGFANINGNLYRGIQAAGFANASKGFNGIQCSGFANINKQTQSAIQATGFVNATVKADSIYQFAGFANVALIGYTKIQMSAFTNVADHIDGLQATGFGNIAGDVNGIQAAGFINIAKTVKGIQLSGIINVCDSLDGIALSFINIVRQNGYRGWEFSINDWAPFQISYKMGTQKLYNIYSVSKLASGYDRYSFGFGFGHTHPLSTKTELNIELINHQAFSLKLPNKYGGYQARGYDQMTQLKTMIKHKLKNGIGMSFGPTINFSNQYYTSNLYFNQQDKAPITNNKIQPYWKTFGDSEQTPTRLWIGFSAGITLN